MESRDRKRGVGRMRITTDIRTLNEYCLTRNKSIVAKSGKLRGFNKDRFVLEHYRVIN